MWHELLLSSDVRQYECHCAFIDDEQVLICPEHNQPQMTLDFE